MTALRIQMHLHGNPGVLQRQCSKPASRSRCLPWSFSSCSKNVGGVLAGDRNIRIQPKFLIFFPQMPRIKSHRKIRAAAFLVRRIHRRIQTPGQNACSSPPPDARRPKSRSRQSCADQYAIPRRESAPAPPFAAHLPAPAATPQYAPYPADPAHGISRACSDAPGRQPTTNLRAFNINGQTNVASAGKHDHRNAGVLPLW